MIPVTPSNSNLSFGMAVKFNDVGKHYYNRVFAYKPELGSEFLRQQASNRVSDIYVKGDRDVYVNIGANMWKIVGSLPTANSKTEEVLLIRNGRFLGKKDYKTILCDIPVPFIDKYGEEGCLLAAAECIANHEASKSAGNVPSLLSKVITCFNSSNIVRNIAGLFK